LFELESNDLRSLARSLTEAELSTLSRYLTGLEKRPRERVLRAVAASPGKMQTLASATVRDAILASTDQSSAVDMMLRSGPGTPSEILADARLAVEGQVSPMLIWERHPVLTLASIVPLLLLFVLFGRIFRSKPKRTSALQPAPTPPPAS
jgi:hypothetical protein